MNSAAIRQMRLNSSHRWRGPERNRRSSRLGLSLPQRVRWGRVRFGEWVPAGSLVSVIAASFPPLIGRSGKDRFEEGFRRKARAQPNRGLGAPPKSGEEKLG